MITAIVFCLGLGAAAWVWNARDDPQQLPGFLAGGLMLLVMGGVLWVAATALGLAVD